MKHLQPDAEYLLNTRFKHMARNTVDYWMVKDSVGITESDIVSGIAGASVTDASTLQLYIHIPFCAQNCSFCAFSGGNSIEFSSAARYVDTLVMQLRKVLSVTPAYGKLRIRSVHIGGGSPDLVRCHIGRLLEVVRGLDGIDDSTEIAVECAPATTRIEFLDECMKFGVTKLSFGIQTINPEIRRHIKMPTSIRKVEEICDYVGGAIPIVNADFITGLPGQTLKDVDADLAYALAHPIINAVSTYLLTPGAAPSLVADVTSKRVPQVPTHVEQARFRLHSYSTLYQAGWVRRGTNTYIDPATVDRQLLNSIPGNECIGSAHYDTFLVAVGAQAIGCAPGVRFENTVNIDEWMKAVNSGGFGFNHRKSALVHQRDMSLWAFPLFHQGLSRHRLDEMKDQGCVSQQQIETLNELVLEGLIIERAEGYKLTVLGEVFMGHVVKLLKSGEGQQVIDRYIDEGYAIADAINSGVISQDNAANDRQIVLERI